jgi:hypothetical protein
VQAPKAQDAGVIGFRIKASDSVPLSLADSGTVFMNGWELRYTKRDHHVQGLGSAIVNVSTTRSGDDFVLNWEAGGVLTDQNGDDPYQWCYSYTVVFWSRRGTAFDAVASSTGVPVMQNTSSDPGNDSALRSMTGAANNPYGPGVVLPQGFAMIFDGDDHHLLQVGLDYGQHATVEPGKIQWRSRTVLKDDDARRDYFAGELVSVLSYSSPQSWHPASVLRQTANGWQVVQNEVSLAPQASDSFCSAVGDPTHAQNYKILNVPYEYAVPVLKGWELGYLCTDHHVREIGASITDFRYEREPNAMTGTLYYTLDVKLRDDQGNLNYGGASIDVFGMNARGIGTHPLNAQALQAAPMSFDVAE